MEIKYPLKFSYEELFASEGLERLDDDFIQYVKSENLEIYTMFGDYRNNELKEDLSKFLIQLALILQKYLTNLFNLESWVEARRDEIKSKKILFEFKSFFVAKKAAYRIRMKSEYKYSYTTLKEWLFEEIYKNSSQVNDFELAIAKLGVTYLQNKEQYPEEIERLIQWSTYLLENPYLESDIDSWILFKLPAEIDFNNLLEVEACNGLYEKNSQFVERDGFHLVDSGMKPKEILNEINNCMLCHSSKTDYCSKGFSVAKGAKEFITNPLGNILTGCPLEIDISEMITLKKQGNEIAALAVLMKNNPMCPVTGHRICNDCMKSCIYQKQDPVNVPEIETAILRDILHYPWGFEIYDLLLRWNPLLQQQWQMQPFNGKKVAVFGLGPAGFTMAYYLLHAGCSVVGFDGVKLEPLPDRYLKQPIYNYDQIKEDLDKRIIWGFGGVAEYGITSRWDKNYLKVIYISLMRRNTFRAFGNVRFGGTISIEDAWKYGFHHIVLALGAGLPKELNIKNSLAVGMRQASDFLMALQLTGLFKKSSLPAYQITLPAVVIGGGLTAVDTATEIQTYYIKQVEHLYELYQEMTNRKENFTTLHATDEWTILKKFISHGEAVKNERHLAQIERRKPNFTALIHRFGGVTIAYRKVLQDSPAYRSNHLELKAALDQGVRILEDFDPKEVLVDDHGHVTAICGLRHDNSEIHLEACSLFVATGSKPNVAYEFEHKGSLLKEGQYYKSHQFKDGNLEVVDLAKHVKEETIGLFTSYNDEGRKISFVGDIHPVFNGSVVNAVASSKKAFPKVLEALFAVPTVEEDKISLMQFFQFCEENFSTTIVNTAISQKYTLLDIKSPNAAKMYHIGQFFKVQLYETTLILMNEKVLPKPLFLFPTKIDKANGLISFQLDLQDENQKLFARLCKDQSIALMGPSAEKIQIPKEERVLIIADVDSYSSLPFLISELNHCKNHIILFISLGDRDIDELISLNVNEIILYTQDQPLASIELYEKLNQVSHVYNAGGERTAEFIQTFKPYLENACRTSNQILTSTFGPMQCLLKGVCGQCLQWQIDPGTGKRTKAVFGCSWHYQPYDLVDFKHLSSRGQQNSAVEILNNLYLNAITVKKKNQDLQYKVIKTTNI